MSAFILTALVASLLFSFFFSGIEIAFLSADKLQIELKRKQGSLWGRIMAYFIHNQSWFIGTTLIGNTLALVVFGIYMSQLLDPWLHSVLPVEFHDEAAILLLDTVISTSFILLTAEFLPKSIFLLNPNAMLRALAIPFQLMYYLLFPLTYFIVSLSKGFLRLFLRIPFNDEKPVFEITDLNTFIKNTQQIKHEEENIAVNKKILHNALEFRSVRIRDCMTHRTEIKAMDIQEGLAALHEQFIQTGHTKIVLYRDSIDNVLGYCHSSALFKKPEKIEDILVPAIEASESQMAKVLWVQLIKENKSLAVVRDEFGGVSGLVTLEDLMEEIFGEIEDEHDQLDLVTQKINDYTYRLSARHEIDYLNEHLKLNLPKGEYDTLGGLILSQTGDFPTEGSIVKMPPFTFTIKKKVQNKIDLVLLTVEDTER